MRQYTCTDGRGKRKGMNGCVLSFVRSGGSVHTPLVNTLVWANSLSGQSLCLCLVVLASAGAPAAVQWRAGISGYAHRFVKRLSLSYEAVTGLNVRK